MLYVCIISCAVNVVKIMGREVALSLYNDTREIESQGGLMIVVSTL